MIISSADEIEKEWVEKGYVYFIENKKEINVGIIVNNGENYNRVNRVFNKIKPASLPSKTA